MFEKVENLESIASTVPTPKSEDSPVTEQKLTAKSELKTQHLKSLKKKTFKSINLYQKRLRRKVKLQKIINLNKNKYNSLSSSSSFSSLSSNSSSFSQITDEPVKKDPPMKLHKFYHSVPFKCPFCFTFKELPTDFIDHLATAHYSDVKLLYEKRCSTVIEGLNEKKRAQEAAEKEAKLEKPEIKMEQTEEKVDTSMQNNRENNIQKPLYTSSLPPRKQQRLLKSPLNDASVNVQPNESVECAWNSQQTNDQKIQAKSEDYFKLYYSNNNNKTNTPSLYSQSNGFIMPTSLNDKQNSNFQHVQSNNKNLILAAAAAASMLNQHGSGKVNYSNKYSNMNSNSTEASMKCAICDRGFEYYSNLRRHIKTKHKIFGKQVKEYVIRHNYSNNNNNSTGSIQRKNSVDIVNKTIDSLNDSTISSPLHMNSTNSNLVNNSKFNTSNSSDSSNLQSNNASSIMMMSPQSSASNQNTSTNYMDLGLTKSNSNGKNSPLSSISSSSMCSVKSNKTKSQSNQKTNEECFEDELDQVENTSSASSTASYPGFPLNKTNTPPPISIGASNNPANMAAMVAAFQTSGMNPNMSDLSNLMAGNTSQNGMNNQMMSLLNNHASAMSKIKSNLLENLLARKLPNKFSPGTQQNDISSMAAAVVAASLNNTSPSSDEISAQSKSTNLSKLLQNIVEMNQMHHFNNTGNSNTANTNHTASLASSSPSSSSSSSSSENEKQIFNTSFKSELCNNQEETHELNSHRIQSNGDGTCMIPDCNCTNSINLKVDENSDSETVDDVDIKKRRFHHLNRDHIIDQDYSDSKQKSWENKLNDNDDLANDYQDQENAETDEKNMAQQFYEGETRDIDDETGQVQANHEIDEEIEEHDIRSRSPSNSSKSSGCSSMSSMIQQQFLQKQQQLNQSAGSNNANKLLMSHLAGCITPPINQLALENHLKNFQHRHLMVQHGGGNYQPHGNYNSYNTNGVKRKKSKEFGLNSFIPSVNTPTMANSMRAGLSNPPTNNEQQNHMITGAPPSPDSKHDSNNQIRYSSEIWRCPYCCYETTSASRYNSHLVCHGWKPYLCPHCGSRSNRLPDMRTHISTFHPEFNVNTFVVLNEEEAKATLKDYMKNRALINRKLKEMRPQPKFKCKLCPYASLYQFNLTKHVKSVHLNEIYNQNNNNNNNNQMNNSLIISSNNDS